MMNRLKSTAVNPTAAATALIGLLAVLTSLKSLIEWVTINYWSVSPGLSLSFMTRDGHCLGGPSVFDPHCFGDYGHSVDVSLLAAPWDLDFPNPYLPVSLWSFRLLNDASWSITHDWTLGLYLYLTILAVALLIPAIWASWRGTWSRGAIICLFLFAMSAPTLSALDRGNSVALLVPVLLGILISLKGKNWKWIVGLIVVGALIKISFGLFVLVLVARRKWLLAGVAIALVLITNFLSFFLYPSESPLHHLASAKADLSIYGTWVSAQLGSWNISIQQFFINTTLFLEKLHVFKAQEASDWLIHHPSVGLLSMVCLVTAAAVFLGKRLSNLTLVVLICIPAFLGAPLSYQYYAVFAVPIAAVVIKWGVPMRDHGGLSSLSIGALLVALSFTLVQFAVPMNRLPISTDSLVSLSEQPGIASVSHMIVAPLWLLAAAALVWADLTSNSSDNSVSSADNSLPPDRTLELL